MGSLRLIIFISLIPLLEGKTQSADELKPNIPTLPTTTLAEAGFNKDSITNLLSLIDSTRFKDFRGLVLIKDNQIVLEEYFNTFWRNSVVDIRSAGKSVTALLLGIALKDGLIKDLHQDVYSFFPKNKYPSVNEDYKKITLKNLLDMSSGLDADTDNAQTPGHAIHWIAKTDWKDYVLNVPVTDTPGQKWVYADINPILISAIIEELTGTSLKDYAKHRLFDPLGIEQFYWYTNSAGQTGAAGNLYLSTLDFAKLGLLVLNNGKYNGSQIISPEYIATLWEENFDLRNNNPFADSYGSLWYKSSRKFGAEKRQYLFASGMGGNHLIVIPAENMVIALTSGAYGQGYGHGRSYAIMSKIFTAIN